MDDNEVNTEWMGQRNGPHNKTLRRSTSSFKFFINIYFLLYLAGNRVNYTNRQVNRTRFKFTDCLSEIKIFPQLNKT